MRVAAYEAPLTTMDPRAAVAAIREQVDRCELDGVEVLCCPEAILGGLGDFAADPWAQAISVEDGALAAVLAPLSSPTVTTIVGFTERATSGALFNSAAVFQRGAVVGVYRKNHPAIRKSVYHAGTELPVFRAGELVFGILICNDSNFPELAASLVGKGAQAIFIPSNNGLPPRKADVVADTRRADVAMARAYGVPVIRADVAGRTDALEAYGSSAITFADGTISQATAPFTTTLLCADVSGRRVTV